VRLVAFAFDPRGPACRPAGSQILAHAPYARSHSTPERVAEHSILRLVVFAFDPSDGGSQIVANAPYAHLYSTPAAPPSGRQGRRAWHVRRVVFAFDPSGVADISQRPARAFVFDPGAGRRYSPMPHTRVRIRPRSGSQILANAPHARSYSTLERVADIRQRPARAFAFDPGAGRRYSPTSRARVRIRPRSGSQILANAPHARSHSTPKRVAEHGTCVASCSHSTPEGPPAGRQGRRY
jgi:hypothetical protein